MSLQQKTKSSGNGATHLLWALVFTFVKANDDDMMMIDIQQEYIADKTKNVNEVMVELCFGQTLPNYCCSDKNIKS